MKLSTIFMLAVALALFYCWTADGHSNAGKRDDRRPLQKKNHHKGHHPDNITIQRKDDGKKFECKCVLRNPHQSQRERHQMNELQKRHLHGRKCHCKSLVKKPESSIPLS